jgi:putative transposase
MGQRSEHVKRRRHTPEQIVRKLREADRLLADGTEVPEVAKALEISEATYHRWRAQYGGMKADDVKRLKELEAENARLKRIVADQVLEVAALKEISKGRMFLLCQLEAAVGRVEVDGDSARWLARCR